MPGELFQGQNQVRPPKKKAKVSSQLINRASSEPESEPRHLHHLQKLSLSATSQESQIPSGMTPEGKAIPLRALFDIATFRLQPELRDSFHLLQRGTPYPYEPARPEDFRVWTHPSQSDIVHICPEGHPHATILRKELPPACSSLMHSCAITFSTSALGAEERSFAGGIVQDI
ncbi:hypothetical protein CK203_038045 [Vitis vinifera]|uniref:Uncharacterized protein n=1 Tax=Vitis vinifera TaxID=29760 RepID=A0A438HNX1_VITVI|nr:hypothetical protein CK203_038045 [Vitis vinifera]